VGGATGGRAHSGVTMASIDEFEILGAERAAHLLRRTGFGATAKDIEAYQGLEAGAAADKLVNFKSSGFKPNGPGRDLFTAQTKQHNNWVKFMMKQKAPECLREKLTLFWHDHFATGIAKVADTRLMATQNRFLRQNCAGDMKTLVKGMNVDPAMMEWLDTVRNFKEIPNENYSRELEELFTLGVFDLAGNPNYTQDDIVQIARAFTGHSYHHRKRKHEFHLYDHDRASEFPLRGPKVIYQSTGGFGAGGRDYTQYPNPIDDGDFTEAQLEIDQVTDIIFEHKDSEGKNTVARRTARRLLEFFAHGGFADPTPALVGVIDDVIARSGFGSGGSFGIKALLREILLDEEFYASLSDPSKKSVKWPIDLFVGTLRVLGVKTKGGNAYIPGQFFGSAFEHLAGMGQTILDPPSVFGWDWEASWVSSQTLLARYGFAVDVITARGAGGLIPKNLLDLHLTDPEDIVDAVTELLGVSADFPDPSSERTILIDYLGAGPLDLNVYDTRNRKLHGLIGLVMESPAYQVH
jgi:uncharacterized protein (DUF1800 family)